MTRHRQEIPASGDRRLAIEGMIGRYPQLSPGEIEEVCRYLTREASATEVGIIASNEKIYPQYRRFNRDHLIDRPGWIGWSVTAVLCAIVLGAFTFAILAP